MATFAAIVDFPSPIDEEVNRIVLISLFGMENFMFVRTVRNCSEIIVCGFELVTSFRAIGLTFFLLLNKVFCPLSME